MDQINYAAVGVIRSPYTTLAGMPIQTVAAPEARARVEVAPAYWEGLRDIEGFSHLWLICHLHQMTPGPLVVTPFLDDQPHGIFATRSPRRPNPLGLSVVRLEGVAAGVLHITGVDMVDGTPVLDIKPYVPAFDVWTADRIGWFEKQVGRVAGVRADDRFGP